MSHGTTEFNAAAARIDTPDNVVAARTVGHDPTPNVTVPIPNVAEPTPDVAPAAKTIQCESNVVHDADVAEGSLQAACQSSILGDIAGACDKLANEVGMACASLGQNAPAPAEGQQQTATLDQTLAAQRAIEAENNTTWTHRSNNMEFKAPGGMA